ncbi:MAG: hypothetical protein ABIZ70_03380 [Gemmatimonadales bacterium]
MSLIRQFRAALVLAGLWAMVWGASAGLLAGALVLAKSSLQFYVGAWVFAKMFAGIGATLGAISGLVFAIALSRNREAGAVTALETRRIARMGAVAGVALPLGVIAVAALVNGTVTGFLTGAAVATVGALVGSGSAVATLQLARHAPAEEREALSPSPLRS